MSGPSDLEGQLAIVSAWITSDDARLTARRLLAKYRLRIEPGDLVNETWAKIAQAFARREEPYDDLGDEKSAARFAYRTMDNLCRDSVRSSKRRGEVVEYDDLSLAYATAGGFSEVDQKIFMEQLLFSVGVTVKSPHDCPGCPPAIAAAVALETVHLMMRGDIGDETGRQWLDRLMYEALDLVDHRQKDRSSDAQRQRKLRCGRCATEIITRGLDKMGVRR